MDEYAKHNPVGRPPKYATPELMQEAIDRYFDEVDIKAELDLCEQTVLNCPSISELAISLGFADRYSMYEYGEKEEFTYTIKQVKARMCSFYEKYGATGLLSAAFVIFMLKNYGYTDKTEHEVYGKDGNPLFDDAAKSLLAKHGLK